jgi:hypothetical protein
MMATHKQEDAHMHNIALEVEALRKAVRDGKLVEFHGQLRTREEIAAARKVDGGYVL